GGDRLVHELFIGLPGQKWSFIFVSQAVIFVLGFFLDFVEICFIVVPILTPIASFLGLDLLWYALLIAVNLQTSFLTPPFGFSLFYLKAVAPDSIKIQQIYRGVVPFVAMQLTTLGLIIAFPQIAKWLPQMMDRINGITP
ncbi:MAG TPA: TRAP transporter large permease subunit, partial [Gammaproteobacteria bacterium]|nr:TRAP transporter large permease subunit [Gammaproteobacteria bacterium]